MPLTTEQPTFFGPPDAPLFGVLHLPADNQIRGGILICGSLGKEGMDSVRLQRILAEGLAGRGFAVLHFDYLGSGDSAYGQARDTAVSEWTASVGYALEYLTLIGAEATTSIGIRAGCLVLDNYLKQSRALSHVVYLDPPGTGRRYLREHSTLYRLSVGADAGKPGEVTIIGGRISEPAAAEFTSLQLGTDPVDAYGLSNVLLVGRTDETDKRITALKSANGVDSLVAHGLAECAQPRETLLPIPFAAISSISEWIDGKVSTSTRRAAPRYLTTVTIPIEGPDGLEVIETIERIGPNSVFAIRTLPKSGGPAPTKSVVFFVTANDTHVGPAREWVELSRLIAATGQQSVRWDPTGLGLSGEISRDPWRAMYSKRDIADSISVTNHARQGSGAVELVGICSGSWYAAHVARKVDTQSAILVNLMAWNWRLTSTLLSQWKTRRKTLSASAVGDPEGGVLSEYRRRRLPALLGPASRQSKNLLHTYLPRPLLRGLSRIGLVWSPEDVLTTLARRQTDVTLIASPEDAALFTAKGGPAALELLRPSAHPPRLIAPATGDHAAHHPAILAAIRREVLAPSAETNAEHDQLSAVRPADIRRIP